MPRKRPKLDHHVTQVNVGTLPREILCILFSNLDEKSKQRASETCKLWFEVIRNDQNLSSHVCLKRAGLKELQSKIEESEWIWNRWPVLAVLELGPLSVNIDEPKSIKEAVDLIKSINFKECPTLEKVSFSVNFDLEDFIPDFGSELKIAYVEQLTFNPQNANESFGVDQISALHIVLDSNMPFMNYSRLTRFNENMVKYLNDSIQTVKLTVKYVTMINYLSNACDFVTDLYVRELTGSLLRSANFTVLQQFKRMKKCHVNVTVWSLEEWLDFQTQGPKIVDEKIQEITEVKFVFKNCFTAMDWMRGKSHLNAMPSQSSDLISESLEITKMPFEKSVSKLIEFNSSSVQRDPMEDWKNQFGPSNQ